MISGSSFSRRARQAARYIEPRKARNSIVPKPKILMWTTGIVNRIGRMRGSPPGSALASGRLGKLVRDGLLDPDRRILDRLDDPVPLVERDDPGLVAVELGGFELGEGHHDHPVAR